MNETYRKYLSSKVWKDKRKRIFKERGSKCNRCETSANLQLHHKTYKRIYKEKDSDLEILCGTCHQKEHNVFYEKKRVPANSFIRYKKSGVINLKSTRVPSGRFSGTKFCYMKKDKHIKFMLGYIEDGNNPEKWVEVMKLKLKRLGVPI